MGDNFCQNCSLENLRVPLLTKIWEHFLFWPTVRVREIILCAWIILVLWLWVWQADYHLTLSWQRSILGRNQSIHLLCKSMDWFIYGDLRHERFRMRRKRNTRNLCLIKYQSGYVLNKINFSAKSTIKDV